MGGNSAVSSLLNGVSALVIGGYLAATVYQGNANALLHAGISDYGYLEFLTALIVLKVIVDYQGTHEVAILLIFAAVIAAALRFVSNTSVNTQALSDFSSGKAGLFATMATLFGGI